MSALQRGDTDASLEFDEILGQGGMGTVHLAEQRSLGRHVAVKRLNDGVDRALHRDTLLSEGWVLGSLEHPNIPPVHDAMLDANGDPLLLLKRIEGVEWARLLGDEATVRKRFGESLLDWNLGVLDTICNALSYAHSKNIVHRDLKPENVMIGAFGEVYVLDWGLAASLHRDPAGRLPFIGDSSQPAGTPCFMAPELLHPNPGGVDKRTDVYLIGAVLYEVLVGKPPHGGSTMREVTESILRSEPEFPDRVPRPLADICTKAMRANADDRYGSVEELQQELRSYLNRRASILLIEEASERLSRLRAMAEVPSTDERSSEMFSVFSECRFAFRQVLAAFPDDTDALAGLAEATELMARTALEAGELDAAKTFVRELQEPPQTLLDDLARLGEQQERRRLRLEKLERHQDSDVGKGRRIVFVALFTAFMSGGSLAGELTKAFAPSLLGILTVTWQVVLLAVFLLGYKRARLEETENNRLTYIIIYTALIGQLLATASSRGAGFPIETTMLVDSAVWVTAAVVALLSMGRIYLPSVLGYIVCMLVITWSPSHTYYGIAFGNAVMAVNLGIVYIFRITPRSLLTSND